jgi:hypothetical protein
MEDLNRGLSDFNCNFGMLDVESQVWMPLKECSARLVTTARTHSGIVTRAEQRVSMLLARFEPVRSTQGFP